VTLSGTGIVVFVGGAVFSATGGVIVAPFQTPQWVLFIAPTNQWLCSGTAQFIMGQSKLGGKDVLG
jgi:hypothetical protein